MKKNLPEKRDLASRLTTYAASSGALIALGSTVHGQVIYSGIQNLEVNMPAEYLEIDMDGDLVNDFGFYAYGSSSQWTSGLYNIRSGSGYAVILNPKTDSYNNSWITRMTTLTSTYTSSGITYTSYYYLPLVNGLNAGFQVDSAQTMWTNISYPYPQGAMGYGYYYAWSGPSSGSFSFGMGDFFGQEKYIGIRFFIGAEQHYGWIRVSLGDRIEPMTVIDWAYESTPGDSIITGIGDDQGPEATLDAGLTETDELTVAVTLSFNERAYDFDLGDLVVINGTASDLIEIVPGREYEFDVTATNDGQVTVSLPAGGVVDYPGNENDLASVSWNYEEPVSLGPVTTDGIQIYPNPVKGELNIVLENESSVQITDLNGRVVFKQDQVLTTTIDASGFNPGVYIVQVQDNERIVQHKIVIE